MKFTRCVKLSMLAFITFFYLGLASIGSAAIKTNKIDTAKIIETSTSCVDCFDWQLKGVCFWLKCSLFSCKIRESLKVRHYLPELVITSFSGNSPWDEINNLGEPNSGTITNNESSGELDTQLDFKNVQVIANPALPGYFALSESYDAFCYGSVRVPYVPYFISKYDPMWSNGTIERLMPQSLIGYPKIKALLPLSYWAPEYPRCGWGSHPYDPINAAVSAHRAAHIVTREGQVHVYKSAGSDCTRKCWPPSPVKANDDTNKFQMIIPKSENKASKFGGSAAWANGKYRYDERYAWILWRPYKCCRDRGSWISDVDF